MKKREVFTTNNNNNAGNVIFKTYDNNNKDSSVESLLEKTISLAIEEVKTLKLFTYKDLPAYMQDNEAIHAGYRAFYTGKECIKSIFAIHNETGNIWTHLIGTLFFVSLLCYTLLSLPSQATAVDYLIVTIFMLSATKCLVCSTLFHTFSAHEKRSVFEKMATFDYLGISVLIFGSFLIYLWYGLYCHSTAKLAYLIVVSLVCTSGAILPWFAFFRALWFRSYRTIYFVGLVAVLSVICIHSLFLIGLKEMQDYLYIEYFVAELGFYLLGASIYASRVPEKWFPGRLDHWFHSHQVWHVLIILAAFCHYKGSLHTLHNRLTLDSCSQIRQQQQQHFII